MKYIRKIQSIGRWDGSMPPLFEGAFSTGDNLLTDLKTENNTLSIWSYNTEEEKKEVLAAIALTRDHVEKLAYVEMDDTYLVKVLEIPIVKEKGVSEGVINAEILNRHANLSHIDFWRLGFVAEYLSKLASNKSSHNQLSKKQVFEVIKEQIQKQNIDLNQINPKLKGSYNRMLE